MSKPFREVVINRLQNNTDILSVWDKEKARPISLEASFSVAVSDEAPDLSHLLYRCDMNGYNGTTGR